MAISVDELFCLRGAELMLQEVRMAKHLLEEAARGQRIHLRCSAITIYERLAVSWPRRRLSTINALRGLDERQWGRLAIQLRRGLEQDGVILTDLRPRQLLVETSHHWAQLEALEESSEDDADPRRTGGTASLDTSAGDSAAARTPPPPPYPPPPSEEAEDVEGEWTTLSIRRWMRQLTPSARRAILGPIAGSLRDVATREGYVLCLPEEELEGRLAARRGPGVISLATALQRLPSARAIGLWASWHQTLADMYPTSRLDSPRTQDLCDLHRRLAAIGPEVQTDGGDEDTEGED